MATETTFKSYASGRLPAFAAEGKVPGPGLKCKLGRFTIGTSEYPDDGYVAADLETIVGMTHITAIVPMGPLVNGSGENGFIPGWDMVTRTLRVFANAGLDGMALTVGTAPAVSELATNNAAADAATFDALVIGY